MGYEVGRLRGTATIEGVLIRGFFERDRFITIDGEFVIEPEPCRSESEPFSFSIKDRKVTWIPRDRELRHDERSLFYCSECNFLVFP